MAPRNLTYSLFLVAALFDPDLRAQSYLGGVGDGYASVAITGKPVPTLTGIAPTNGAQGQTLDVVFTGSNFVDTANTSVSVGSGITVNSTTVNNSGQLTVNISINLVTGLKQGWAFAWRSLISGEMLFVSLGLGQMLIMGRDLNDMSQVLAVMGLIMVTGHVVDQVVFEYLERRVRRRWGLAGDTM